MDNSDINIIKNVFISVGNNKLRLAEIYFNESISEIRFMSDAVDWKEIDAIEKRNNFLSGKNKTKQNNISFDGNFNLLIPGGIDSHVHFNTPGFEEREDFEHASTAAAFGGVTTIIDMPCTSLPPVTSVKNMGIKLESVKMKSAVDFAFWGGVSGNDFKSGVDINKQIIELSEAGVVGFKAYLISGMETFTDLNYAQIKKVAELINKTNKPLAIHAEDKSLIESRKLKLQKDGKNGWLDYCNSRDINAEVKAVEEIIEISEATKTKTHIVHLSSKLALDLISDAQKIGIPISAETCPHYLYFTQNDFSNSTISNFLKTAPPVKFGEDRIALWNGLLDGTLSFVVTDHAGSIPERDKSSHNFWKVYGGIPGVEHRIPFLFSEGFKKEKINLEQTINLLSTNVAKYFGLKKKGELSSGFDADFALINLWNSEIINAKNMHSKGKFTPFINIKFKSTVESTWLRGNLITERNSKFSNKFHGCFIPVN